MKNDGELRRFGVSMEDELLERFDRAIARKGYATRSEAIRDMVRNSLAEESLSDDRAEAVATISLVYNHHVRDLTAKLTEYQHHSLDLIVSTLHIHLDEDNCLEVLIVRGPYRRVRELAEHLISVKGVRHGKFVTATGQIDERKNRQRRGAHKHSH